MDLSRRRFLKGLASTAVSSLIPKVAFANEKLLPFPLIKILAEYPIDSIDSIYKQTNINKHKNPNLAKIYSDIKSINSPVSNSFLALINELQGKSKIEVIKEVQKWFNNNQNIFYQNELGDNWLEIVEFLTKKGGDCEDHAFAKRITLLLSGAFKEEELYLLIGYFPDSSISGKSGHANLAVKIENEYFILDNSYDTGDFLIKFLKYIEIGNFYPTYILDFSRNKNYKVKKERKEIQNNNTKEKIESKFKNPHIRKLLSLDK
jgi:predicted transglutaminase-like cysteine proteinase